MLAFNSLLLNGEYTLRNILKALASVISTWILQVILKYYTKIFYMFYKGNVQSFQ
jgi:hypothetical protein